MKRRELKETRVGGKGNLFRNPLPIANISNATVSIANVNVVGSNPITRFCKCRQNREIRESDGILHYGLWATKRPL